MEEYEYQPFPLSDQDLGRLAQRFTSTRWFRLVNLYPGVENEDLVMKMETYEHSQAPPYEALSYC